jgi:putative endonuclease
MKKKSFKKINTFTHKYLTIGMAKNNLLGEKGENMASDFLMNLGFQIVEKNWREKKFEIDIIAYDNNEIVFVEVKTRSTSAFGKPEEAVTIKKQQHLIDGADYYLNEKEIDLECRFDVISIIENDKESTINHLKNAFYPCV